MENTTLKTAFAIALACSFAGCNPAPPDPMAKKPAGPTAPQTQDNALSEKVKSALTGTPEIRAGGLQVSAADGVVTLDGTVEGDRDKQRAALTAMDVEGVRSVINNLVVMKGAG